MPAKRYIVRLTEDERTELLGLITKGITSARLLTRARILLKADEGWKDKEIAQALNSSVATIERIRQRFVEGNLEKALHDDPAVPTVCFDEKPKQLIVETRVPCPTMPGQSARYDYEYERNGTCNLFMFFEPLRAWRHVDITDRRTGHDWAYAMKDLVDVYFPDAERIRVVMDNLNTHAIAALYNTFEPAEARRIARKLESHNTPKHGSWLNMAEIELSVFGREYLNRRIPDVETLQREVAALEAERNAHQSTAHWRFATADARIKLRQLYPSYSR